MTQSGGDSPAHNTGPAFIALLGLCSGLSAFGMASVVPALPALSRMLHASYGSIQFLVSGYLLGLALFQPLQGMLCDRFGRRPVLLLGFSIFAIASVAASLAASLPLLVLARFLQALGASVATVVSRAMVRDTHAPERAAVALSFISAVMGIAPILAPIAGGLVLDGFGWRGIFVMHSGMALILLLWMSFSLRETRPAMLLPPSVRQLLAGFAVLVRDPRFMGNTLTYGFVSGAMFSFITVGAEIFHINFGIGATKFALVWALLSFANMAGAAVAGTLARRIGTRRVMQFGMRLNIFSGALFLSVCLWPTPYLWAYLAALALQIASNGLVSPLALAGAVSDHPSLAGIASGLSSALAMLVSMFSAVAAGVFFSGSALSCAVQMLLGCICASVAVRFAFQPAPAQPLRNSS